MWAIILFVLAVISAFALTALDFTEGVGKIGTFVFRGRKVRNWACFLGILTGVLMVVSSMMNNPIIDPLFSESMNIVLLWFLTLLIEAVALILALVFIWCLILTLEHVSRA
ncbi:MAG: hypothetical protein IJS26_02635 [Alphaproteobacteria bacterium]|nr:hypothetical protein [Alphaproteobacteria bacterium]